MAGNCPGFTESSVIDRNDDHAFGRWARAREKETPVEGQVFDPVQSGRDPLGLINADPDSQNNAGRKKYARQQLTPAVDRLAFTGRSGKEEPGPWRPPSVSARWSCRSA